MSSSLVLVTVTFLKY